MGSLESGIPPIKRERQHHHPLLQRNRSRSFLFKRFSYIQWICSTCVFFFFVVLFQMFLPGLVVIDKSDKPPWRSIEKELLPPDMLVFKERGVLSFGEDVRLEPTKLLMSFQRDAQNSSGGFNTTVQRFGFRKPKLALVSSTSVFWIMKVVCCCERSDDLTLWFSLFSFVKVFADLLADPEQLLMVTVSNALLEIGYAIEV